MLLDKKRASAGIKVFALLIAVSFVASMALFVVPTTVPAPSNPKTLPEFIQAGNFYSDSEQYSQAIDMYQKALDIDPKNADVRVDMAIAYFYSNKPQDAIKQGLEALKYNQKHAKAHFNLGVFYSSSGQNAEAKKHLQKYLELEPNGDSATTARQMLGNLGQ